MSTKHQHIKEHQHSQTKNSDEITIQMPTRSRVRHDVMTNEWNCPPQYIKHEDVEQQMKKFLSIKIPSEMSPLAGIPKQFDAFFFYNSKLQRHERCCLIKMILTSKDSLASIEILMKGLIYREMPPGMLLLLRVPGSKKMKDRTYPFHTFYVKNRYVTGRGCTLCILEYISSPQGI